MSCATKHTVTGKEPECPTCRDTGTICIYCFSPLDSCACNNDASVDGDFCPECLTPE